MVLQPWRLRNKNTKPWWSNIRTHGEVEEVLFESDVRPKPKGGCKKTSFRLEDVLRLHKVFLPSNYYPRSWPLRFYYTVGRVSKLKILAFGSPGDIGSNKENTKCNTPGWCVELNLDLRNLDHSHPKEHDQEVTKLHQNNQLLHRHMSIDHWRHQDRVVMKILQILGWNTPDNDGFTIQRFWCDRWFGSDIVSRNDGAVQSHNTCGDLFVDTLMQKSCFQICFLCLVPLLQLWEPIIFQNRLSRPSWVSLAKIRDKLPGGGSDRTGTARRCHGATTTWDATADWGLSLWGR